jgi:hypothetical protein
VPAAESLGRSPNAHAPRSQWSCDHFLHVSRTYPNIEQIKFLLGHSSIQTTERYLGSEQEIEIAINDNLGL